MKYSIVQHAESRSFPSGDPFLANASPEADIVVHLGAEAGPLGGFESSTGTNEEIPADAAHMAILIELGKECLGVHTGESGGREGDNRLGFARYRNGGDAPSDLVEIVRQPGSDEKSIEAARAVFESAGLHVVVCADQAGRIIDRLVRPKYNAALRFLDEGLASAESMDLTCRLGLSYPDGPIERVERGGLVEHHDVTRALFETYGTPGYAPARRAVVASMRRDRGCR